MAKLKKKIWLIHGECDYLVFKELKSIKKTLNTQNISVTEMFGAKSLRFDEIYNTLSSSDLFLNSSAVIIRNITDTKSFYPFVESLVEYIKSDKSSENELYIVNFSKVLKTSKLTKAITEHGEIKEFNQPKPAEIQDMIKKSIPITPDAAELLMQFTNSNLFQIKNEIEKLKNYQLAKNKERVDSTDVEELCIKTFSQNDVWGIGAKYLNWKLDSGNMKLHRGLMKEVDDLLLNNVPIMQILYSFYQYVLYALKFRIAINDGKIQSQRDAFTYGYFFVKEFYDKRNKMKLDELKIWNKELLEVEYGIKSGEMDEILGVKRLLAKKVSL
jgi:DNA polymerase III delta subunit